MHICIHTFKHTCEYVNTCVHTISMSADVDILLHLKTSVEDSTHRCFRKGDRYTKNREAGRILDACGCQTRIPPLSSLPKKGTIEVTTLSAFSKCHPTCFCGIMLISIWWCHPFRVIFFRVSKCFSWLTRSLDHRKPKLSFLEMPEGRV